jgi:type 1 fimbriae regulatory protein FimB/type 1 fimbriae regulatory protein FimE
VSEPDFPFQVHAHMLRHACGYVIQHTVRYTELSPVRFKDVWR